MQLYFKKQKYLFKLLLLNLTYFYPMKIQNIFILLLFLNLIGCKDEVPLNFSTESFTEETFDICQTVSCPEITINYIKAVGDKSISEKINLEIINYITTALNIGEDSSSKAKTINDAASGFIKVARLHAADFPDMSAEYFAEINISDLHFSAELVSIEMHQYFYTGGAHGSGNTIFLNINPKTGTKIPSEALFKNSIDFTSFAENKFREANKISSNESINSTGFWFDDESFYLPNTIGLTETSLILLYNQYEIASYAEGPVELKIPLEQVKEYLNFKVSPSRIE
ncbi:MAG: hypothetical protein ACI83B_001094 [Sediminicola sp.]|jgi:hypothetical protein